MVLSYGGIGLVCLTYSLQMMLFVLSREEFEVVNLLSVLRIIEIDSDLKVKKLKVTL